MDIYRRIALIPAYEPDAKMTAVAEQLKRSGFNIIIVNDGSGDKFSKLFEHANEYATVLKHMENKGKGAALKTGLRYILENYEKPYTVVTVDADGQHKAADVLKVSEEAEKNRNALTLGSRMFKGKVPLRSRFGNSLTRAVYRFFSGTKVYDTQTGLRAFSDRMAERLITIDGERYEYEMNMLMTLADEKVPIKEVEIETVYLDDNASSHFNPIKDSCRVYREILKFSGSSFICFLIDYLMYCLLLMLTGVLVFSNVAARIVSATINYTLNRKVVFKSKTSLIRSVLQYAGLAVFILILNTFLLEGLSRLGLNSYAVKIPVELIMSGISFLVQHKIIFKNKEEKRVPGNEDKAIYEIPTTQSH